MDESYRPDWVFGRPEAVITPGMQRFSQPQLGAPSAQGQVSRFRAEDLRARNLAAALDQQAQTADDAQSAATRQPTGRGSLFDLDPITGRLREVSQGVKGATPEIWQANLGADLKSASEKVASGRLFEMSASEKVAWDKTKVDIAMVSPGFNKLSEKAIAGKIMDREWVNASIVKAKQQAEAFDVISAKATDVQKIRQAMIHRELMLDLVETLEDKLRIGRPVTSGQQGPKTRAAIKNLLSPENQNAMSQ